MELRDYLRIARRRWLLIVGSAVAAVAIAALVTSQATSQYASTARVFISTTPSNSSDAYQGGLFSEQRVASYADLVSGLELSQRVIDQLRLDTSAESLASKIQASVVPDTVVLKITVTDASPIQAQRINDSVVEQLQKFVTELETPPGSDVPLLKATVVDSPRLPG
ncbi:MAG: capsular biosynthesis protein, partial [Marmoricola sp.]|nr:capsular biosynthesis protein [Marmoricola sp.]